MSSNKNNQTSELLDDNFVDSEFERTTKLKPRKNNKPNLKRDTRRLMNWLDGNVLPVLATIGLSGFAVLGVREYLPTMNENVQLAASVVVVVAMIIKIMPKH